VGVQNQGIVAGPAVGNHSRCQDTIVNPPDTFFQEKIEHSLVLNALLLVNAEYAGRCLLLGNRQPHVNHGQNRCGNGFFLGLHEISQCIVEIKNYGVNCASRHLKPAFQGHIRKFARSGLFKHDG